MYSAAATGILESRSSSRTASFFTASGIPAASILARSSSISLACSSPSPSSFWIAFICSRRKYSRWFLPTSDCTCDWMREPSSSTSSSLIRIRFSASIRARTSSVDRISCFTGVPMVARLEAMKSASLPGSVMFAASVCRSSDSSGDSDTTCWKLLLMLRWSASISRRSSSRSASGATVTAARRYGRAWTMRSSVRRSTPCTISRRLPSGSLNILWMCVAVPTGYRSSCIGSSTEASRCVKTPISLPEALASSTRRTEASRATASGMNELGNRTVSRSGSTGSSGGIWNDRSASDVTSLDGRSLVFVCHRNRATRCGAAYPISSALHVDEERSRAAALRHQAVALLLHLARLFTVLAADRERQRAQPALADLLTALETISVASPLPGGGALRRSC